MKFLKDLELINKGIITVYGQRGSGKTVLSLWIALKKLINKNEIIVLFTNFYSIFENIKNIKKVIPIEFVEISSIEDIENFIVDRGKKGIGNSIIIIDRISIFRLEPYESLSSYRKLSILLALLFVDSFIQNNLYILNYSDGEGEKAFNILKYFSNMIISTDFQDGKLKIFVDLKEKRHRYEEFIYLENISKDLYG